MRQRWLLISSLQGCIARPSSLSIREDPKFEWTALGDSYASGVGSVKYVDGRRCLRYDQAWPVQLNGDENLATKDYIFNNVVCSGSHYDDVENYQFYDENHTNQPSWQFSPRPKFGNPQMATLAVGGDDIDFPGILFNCVLETHIIGGPAQRTCDEQRKHSWGLINSPDLINNIDHLIKKTVTKGREGDIGDKFKLYVTGYAEFFNEVDNACDTVTFARTANPKPDGKEHINMTTALRKDFNQMSVALNAAIEDAVSRNKDNGVKFIDIQANDALKGHRFCEPGVKEPDQRNDKLWFWHYPYNEEESDNTKLLQEAADKVTKGLSVADIGAKYPETRDYTNALFDAIDENKAQQVNGGDVEAKGLWDSIGWRTKVFHPQVVFHGHIKDLVIAQYNKDKDDEDDDGGDSSSGEAKLTCTGIDTTIWMGRAALESAIETFCGDAEKQGVQDPNSGSLVRKYNDGGLDQATLSMDWPSGSSFKPRKDECVGYMTSVMDSCNGNDPKNPMNWKHGGNNQVGEVRYNVVPTKERYKAGICSAHVHEKEDFSGIDGPGTKRSHKFHLTVDGKDADGKTFTGTNGEEVEAGQDGGNPYKLQGYYAVMEITPEARGDYVQFTIGDQSWKSDKGDGVPRCQLGDWDGHYTPVGRDMDIFFNC